jgi:hypothetical protein
MDAGSFTSRPVAVTTGPGTHDLAAWVAQLCAENLGLTRRIAELTRRLAAHERLNNELTRRTVRCLS